MINKVTLVGHLGKDPEVKTLENGTKVASFSLATTESYKDKSDQWQNLTEWHNIIAWRGLADRCEKLSKGSLVYVEGKISRRSYKDKDGVEKHITDIVASTINGLEKREKSSNPESSLPPEVAETLPF